MKLVLLISATITACTGSTFAHAGSKVFEQLPASPPAPGLSSPVGFGDVSFGLRTADDFLLGDSHQIAEIRWWGGCHTQAPPASCSPQGTDQFTFSFYANSAGLPGTLLLETEGTLLPDTTGASYAAALEVPFDAAGGTRYWLSIFNEAPHVPWGWTNSTSGNNDSAVAYGPAFGIWQDVPGTSVDTAFQLVVPEPLSFALLWLGCAGFMVRRRSHMLGVI